MSTVLAVVSTVSNIGKKDLHTPFSGDKALRRVRGLLGIIYDNQQVVAAVNATTYYTARHDGELKRILVDVTEPAAAGESITFDVQVNGTSVFSSTPEITSASPGAGVYDVSGLIKTAGVLISTGAIIKIVRTVASQSTLTTSGVSVEWG